MSRDEIMYLQDIASSCDKVLRFTKGLGLPDLVQDEKAYDAVVRNLEDSNVRYRMAKNCRDERHACSCLFWN